MNLFGGRTCASLSCSAPKSLPAARPQAVLRVLHARKEKAVTVRLRSPRRLVPVHINNARGQRSNTKQSMGVGSGVVRW